MSKLKKTKQKQKMVSIGKVDPSKRYYDIFQNHFPDQIISHETKNKNIFIFRCANKISLQVIVLTDKIIRFRYALKGVFQTDFSYAIDPNFNIETPKVDFVEEQDCYKIITTKVSCSISKSGIKVKIEDAFGNIICEDAKGFKAKTTILKGIENVTISKKATKKESFFGLGDKSTSLNLRGKRFENWNTDSFLYDDKTDPLYRTIPFYYGLNNGIGYGIFMDNSFRSHFDFDSKGNGKIQFSAAGGEMNYYFIYGPQLLSVAEEYTRLTGKPDLPPIWALGFHQCRFSYYPESKVRALAEEFRTRQIPCDAIYLDIDYMDGFRCFTWDKSHFPNPSEMVRDLRQKDSKQ